MTPKRWVRAGTDGAPLIAVHTWRGEHSHYARLSSAMGGQTVYSLLPPALDVDRAPRRVDDWVDHHATILASLDLTPPYRIVGWSFGGVVAVELARRLRAAGTDVEFVGMIDTIRPRLHPLSDREFVWYHLAAAAAMPEPERMPYLRQKTRFLLNRRFPRSVAAARRALVRVGLRSGPTAVGPATKPTDPLIVAVHTSYLNYRGDPIPFYVHLYATEGALVQAHEPAMRWIPWLHGGYRLRDIPGEHFTLFDAEHVTALARALGTDLDGS